MNKFLTFLLFFLLTASVGRAQVAPDFTFTDIDGKEYSLYEDFLDQGIIVLLDFFFVDCPPCQELTPEMEKLHQDYANGNVRVIAISDRDSDANIRAFNKDHKTNYISAGSEGGGNDIIYNNYTDNYNFKGFPTYAVICTDGSITWDIWSVSPGLPEVRSHLTSCGALTSVSSKEVDNDFIGAASIFPNPARNFTNLEFNLAETSAVKIELYNIIGKKVNTIEPKLYNEGNQKVTIDMSAYPSGTYFVSIEAGKHSEVLKLTNIQP